MASKLAKAVAERDSGLTYDAGSLTVSGYLMKWLDAVRETITIGTWKQYDTIVRLHIRPTIGKTKLKSLNALQIQSLYRERLDSGLSARRVQYIHVTLHKALKQAVKWSLVPRNVTDAVDPPRPQKEIEPLSEKQVKKLLNTVEGDKLEALYVLAITTGMRQGELLGLQWQDVDLEARTLRVNRNIFGGVVSPPKTTKSRRSIKLSQLAVAALKKHRERYADDFSEWVFCTGKGTPVSCHNVHNRSWKPLLKKAGLPLDTRFHDLRHTAATLLLTKGVYPKIVQELLGHANISITLDTYSHCLPNMQEKVVEAMEDIFEENNRELRE